MERSLEEKVDQLHQAFIGFYRVLRTIGFSEQLDVFPYTPSGHRLSRVMALKEYIEAHPGKKRRELAEQFEVSIRTIDRDIRALEQAGVPIFCTGSGPYDGYRMLKEM